MEDTTSERQKSLEELLQDVEFECPCVTLNENVGVETTDVIVETTTNATQESIDTTAAQEAHLEIIARAKTLLGLGDGMYIQDFPSYLYTSFHHFLPG